MTGRLAPDRGVVVVVGVVLAPHLPELVEPARRDRERPLVRGDDVDPAAERLLVDVLHPLRGGQVDEDRPGEAARADRGSGGAVRASNGPARRRRRERLAPARRGRCRASSKAVAAPVGDADHPQHRVVVALELGLLRPDLLEQLGPDLPLPEDEQRDALLRVDPVDRRLAAGSAPRRRAPAAAGRGSRATMSSSRSTSMRNASCPCGESITASRAFGDERRDLALLPRPVEDVRVDRDDERRLAQRAQHVLEVAAPAGHVVRVHRPRERDVGGGVEPVDELRAPGSAGSSRSRRGPRSAGAGRSASRTTAGSGRRASPSCAPPRGRPPADRPGRSGRRASAGRRRSPAAAPPRGRCTTRSGARSRR